MFSGLMVIDKGRQMLYTFECNAVQCNTKGNNILFILMSHHEWHGTEQNSFIHCFILLGYLIYIPGSDPEEGGRKHLVHSGDTALIG